MKPARYILFTLPAWACALLLSFGAVPGQCPADQPATMPKASARALAHYVKIINGSDDASTVLSAYSKATAIDSRNPTVLNAYVRRMLKFGLPRAAGPATRMLTLLEPDNALAWATVGYLHGKRGDYGDALTATIRALEYDTADTSVLHNAGQLVAWYDSVLVLPKLPDRTKRALDKLKGTLEKSEPFAKSYKKVKDAFRERAMLRGRLEVKLTAAEASVQEARRTELALRGQLQTVRSNVDDHNREIDRLYRELHIAYLYPYAVDAAGNRIYGTYSVGLYRQDIFDRIRNEERAIDALKKDKAVLSAKLRTASARVAKLRGNLAALRKESLATISRLERHFRWDPPMVDGVFTPEADRFPQATSRPVKDVGPEATAARRLELAKLYIYNKMYGRAREILNEIITKRSDTKVSAHAKVVLTRMELDLSESE